MASSPPKSESFRTGQAAMLCQLCEHDPKIKWKCLNCEYMMCQRCKEKVHPKFPTAEDHIIIDIKEIGKIWPHPEPKTHLTRIKCRVHSEHICCLYCKTCDCLLCETCIVADHKNHDFGKIIDSYQTKIRKIKHRKKNIEIGIQNLTIREQKLRLIKSAELSNYDKVKQEILDYDKALVGENNNHVSELFKELDQKWKAFCGTIDEKEKEVTEEQRRFHDYLNIVNRSLNPQNTDDVFSMTDSFLKSMDTNVSLVNISFSGVPKFTRGVIKKTQPVFGNLRDVKIQCNSGLQVMKRLKTDLKKITNVVSCKNDTLWVCDRTLRTIEKVDPKREGFVYGLKANVFDTALLPSGELLLSDGRFSNLKLVSSGSRDIQDTEYAVSPLHALLTTGVHVTFDNKFIVGAVNRTDFPATGPRLVIVMDQAGHHEKVFQYDRQHKPIFTLPYRITSVRRGNIAVVDIVSYDWRGRVIVLNQEGEVRNIYTGHPGFNSEDNPFTPGDMTKTPSDNFVVSDTPNHCLHILNSNGDFITFYTTEKSDIMLPCSLAFDPHGQLCIGCDTYMYFKRARNLFIVDNFLF